MRRGMLVLPLVVFLLGAEDPEVKPPEGFQALFNGKDLTGWKVSGGKAEAWGVEKGSLYVNGPGGWLLSEKEYADFELRLEYRIPKGGNSGVALRTPQGGDPAYVGMEIQILDNAWYLDEKNYKGLKPTQLTGSIYDVVSPSEDATKPAGEWNGYRMVVKGRKVTIFLNDKKIVDADLDEHKNRFDKHPGLKREKGHVGVQSHGSRVDFRNIFIKEL